MFIIIRPLGAGATIYIVVSLRSFQCKRTNERMNGLIDGMVVTHTHRALTLYLPVRAELSTGHNERIEMIAHQVATRHNLFASTYE